MQLALRRPQHTSSRPSLHAHYSLIWSHISLKTARVHQCRAGSKTLLNDRAGVMRVSPHREAIAHQASSDVGDAVILQISH